MASLAVKYGLAVLAAFTAFTGIASAFGIYGYKKYQEARSHYEQLSEQSLKDYGSLQELQTENLGYKLIIENQKGTIANQSSIITSLTNQKPTTTETKTEVVSVEPTPAVVPCPPAVPTHPKERLMQLDGQWYLDGQLYRGNVVKSRGGTVAPGYVCIETRPDGTSIWIRPY